MIRKLRGREGNRTPIKWLTAIRSTFGLRTLGARGASPSRLIKQPPENKPCPFQPSAR